MNFHRRDLLQSTAAAALLSAIGTRAWAQTVDTLKIVTGFPPGGTSDTICRRVAERLAPGYAAWRWSRTRPARAGRSRCRR